MTFRELLVLISFVLYFIAILYSIGNNKFLSESGRGPTGVVMRIFVMMALWPFLGLIFIGLGPALSFFGKIMILPLKTLFQGLQ